jgi:hypothetical protein
MTAGTSIIDDVVGDFQGFDVFDLAFRVGDRLGDRRDIRFKIGLVLPNLG